MIKQISNPYPNNYIVFCTNENTTHDALVAFEEYLQERQLRVFVKLGKIVPHKRYFDFKIITNDDEEKKLIMQFFNPPKNEGVSSYRVIVDDGKKKRQYPTNDLRLAIILAKVLKQETAPHTSIELYEYDPNELDEETDDWVVWRDKEGRKVSEAKIKIKNGEMIISNITI